MKYLFAFLMVFLPMTGHSAESTCSRLFLDELAQIRFAKEELKKSLDSAQTFGVMGIGLTSVKGEFALKVNMLTTASAEAIPKTFLGKTVVVDVVGVISKMPAPDAGTTKISANLAMAFAKAADDQIFAVFVRFQEGLGAEQFAENLQKLEALGVVIGAPISPIMTTARATKSALLEAAKLSDLHHIEGSQPLGTYGSMRPAGR